MMKLSTLTPLGLLAGCLAAAEASTPPALPHLTLRAGRFGVNTIVISPDSRTVATAATRLVRLTDIQSGRPARIGEVLTTTPNSMTFSPDGKYLLVGTSSGWVEVLNSRTLVMEMLLPATQWSIYVAVSPDSTALACCTSDGTVQLWDLKSAGKLRTFGSKGERMASLAFSPNGKLLAALSCYGRCDVWNVETGKAAGRADHVGDYPSTLCFSGDGTTLAIVGGGEAIRLWNLTSEKEPNRVRAPEVLIGKPRINGVGFSPEEGRPMNAPLGEYVMGPACISRDLRMVASGLENGSVGLWDVARRRAGRILSTGRKSDVLGGGIQNVRFSPDGRLVAAIVRGDAILWRVDETGGVAPAKEPVPADEWPGPWGPALRGLRTRLILKPVNPDRDKLVQTAVAAGGCRLCLRQSR